MEKSSKRGKIPQSDWPLIMARYEAGETLASIARTYDCSPPAISYVVSRSRARQPGPEPVATPPGGSEPQLIKAAAPDGAAAPAAEPPAPTSSAPAITAPAIAAPAAAPNGHDRPDAAHTSSQHRDNHPPREPNGFRPPVSLPAPQAANGGNGTSHPTAAANGDHRRTLHLSLGNPAPRDGGSQPVEMQPEAQPPVPAQPILEPVQPAQPRPHNGQDGAAPNGRSGMPPGGYPEHMRRNATEAAPHKNGGAFIDHELRARVDGDITVFLAAFDAALGQDTQENRAALREATDRLLRAGARTRIELERLEARMPLPPRNDDRSGDAAWRPR
jgi:hypothetical protein